MTARTQRTIPAWGRALRLAGPAIGALVLLTACSGLPTQVQRSPTQAILDTSQTKLGIALGQHLATHPGLSGFSPLPKGTDAYVARIALARAAERTLDVQYYDLHADAMGAAFLSELLAAADRGVRVRLLLDDLHTSGKDEILAAVDSHPNLEVRLFNPFVHRHARWLDFLGSFSRVNRRMHNKSMTADSQVTIVGGRNIGDEYFAAPASLQFSDFDVMAIGPVVPEVSAEFDQYWNSDVAFPLAPLLGTPSSTHLSLQETRRTLDAQLQQLRATAYAGTLSSTDLARSIERKEVTWYWGRAAVIADRPEKITLPPEDSSTHAMPKLREHLDQAHSELILVSPYFVPGKEGSRWLQDVAHRGVAVRILTNANNATDVPGVAAAYSKYRPELLRAGIEIYEYKPSNGGEPKQQHQGSSKSAKSSLHAKTYMVDAHMIFVGSMNLDPRSVALNTEMGLMIDSDALCSTLRDGFLAQLPEQAFHVQLDTTTGAPGKLIWSTREDGHEERYTTEPGLSAWNSFSRMLQRLLPIEEQL